MNQDYSRIARVGKLHGNTSLHDLLDPAYMDRLSTVAATATGQTVLSAARHHGAPVLADRMCPESVQKLFTHAITSLAINRHK